MKLKPFICAVLALASTGAFSLEPDYLRNLTPYRAQQSASGAIRIWGNPYIPELIRAWEEGFRAHQPGVQVETKLQGTEAAMAGLYGNTADIDGCSSEYDR